MTPTSERKPRVLYLINGFKRGGAERGVLHLLEHGAFEGCELTVLSIIADQSAHVAELRTHGAIVKFLSSDRKMNTWHWMKAVPQFMRAISRVRPDLVILSLPQANIAGRLAALAFPRVKVASFEHNTHLAKSIYERLFRLTSGRVDWLLADCETTADEVRERLYRKRPERQIVLPLVSFSASKAGSRSAAGDSPFTVISAARFTHVKNQQAIILAARLLKDRGDPVRFILYGEGPNLERDQALAQALEVTDVVIFPGFDPQWFEHRADLFVVASKHEGLCIVALEAMSRGVPVLATRVGGLKDYGEQAKVRFLDEPTPVAVADAVSHLMKNPTLLAEMKAAGIETVQRRFSDRTIDARCAAFASDISALIK